MSSDDLKPGTLISSDMCTSVLVAGVKFEKKCGTERVEV